MITAMLILLFTYTSSARAGLEELNLEDISGLIPSFMLDRTGFENDTFAEEVGTPESPVVPLLPMYQSGAFGKKVQVGGVVEEKYYQSLGRSQKQQLRSMISTQTRAQGTPMRAIEYQGRLYAVRSDYEVIYQNSSSIRLGITFGAPNTIILGTNQSFGLSLDFGSPLRIGKQNGLNAGSALQSVLDDWSIATKPDETKSIIDQVIKVTPLLLSYLGKSKPLFDEADRLLPLLPVAATELAPVVKPQSLVRPDEKSSTKEWNRVRQELATHVQTEEKLRREVAPQIAAQKVIGIKDHEQFIQHVCDRLAFVYDIPVELWPRCRIATSLVPNAWAYPGGDIFISAGLLGILSEIDSVALVLGHEIGHVVARHSSKRSKAHRSVNYASTYISAAANLGLTGLSLTGGMGLIGSVNFISWFPQVMATSGVGSLALQKGFELAMLAPAAGLMLQSREHEHQADRLGQEAAFVAGAELEKMNQGWGEFVDFFDENFPKSLSLRERLMASHPDSRSRLEDFAVRSHKLAPPLAQFSRANALSPDLRNRYSSVHKLYRTYATAYARMMRQKLEQPTKANKRNPRASHFLSTLVGPHSECIKHALGGY